MAESFHTDADLTGSSENFDAEGLTLGETFMFGVDGSITHARFRAHSTLSGGTYTGAVWEITDDDPAAGSGDGTLLDSENFGALTPGAWNTVAFSPAVPIAWHVAYRVGVFTSVGRYLARGSFYNGGSIIRGNAMAAQDAAGIGGFTVRNGTFFYAGALSYPQDVFNSATYFVDFVFEPDWWRIEPFRTPELTAAAGLYSFGMDFTVDTDTRMRGMLWYHPPGLTKGDVTARLYNAGTMAVLASGTVLQAAIVDGWQIIPFDTPYTASSGTTYTGSCETAGDHGYDTSVTLPTVDLSGHVTFTGTRYESGGGYPATDWDSGWHGIDLQYDFNVSAENNGTLSGTLPALTGTLGGVTSVPGVLAGNLPAITGTSAGVTNVPGALAGTLPVPTAAVTGNTNVLGAAVGTLPFPTGSIQSVINVPGALAGILPAITGSFEAGAEAPNEGELAGVLPLPTGALIANTNVPAVLVGTLPMISGLLFDVRETIDVTAPGPSDTDVIASLTGSLSVTAGLAGDLDVSASLLTGGV